MKNVLFAALIGAVATTTAWAQTPEAQPAVVSPVETFHLAQAERVPLLLPAQQPAPAPAPAAVQRSGPAAPRNIRFEIVITETGGPKPTTKAISLTVNDGNGSGSVRNLVKAPGDATVSLNVDVRGVNSFEGGAIRAAVNVEYQPYTPDVSVASSGIQSSITSMFQDGRRTQILQTSDPLSDRRTTIEVLATVLK